MQRIIIDLFGEKVFHIQCLQTKHAEVELHAMWGEIFDRYILQKKGGESIDRRSRSDNVRRKF